MCVLDVRLKIRGLRETLSAHVAVERPQPRVRVGVALELRGRDEALPTFSTTIPESVLGHQ